MYKNKEWLKDQYLTLRKTQSKIAQECKVTTSTIERWIKKHNLVRIRSKVKYLVREDLMEIDNPIFCYYLGWVASDGYIAKPKGVNTYRICLRLKDTPQNIKILELLKNYFEYSGDLAFYNNSNNGINTVEFRMTSDKLVNKLLECGIPLKDKTFNLQFPKNLSRECLFAYLRGITDGDGSISIAKLRKYGHVYKLCTASFSFIEDIVKFLENEYKSKISYFLQMKKYPAICFGGKTLISFLNDIYRNCGDFKLDSKYQRYEDIVRTLEKSKELKDKEPLG